MAVWELILVTVAAAVAVPFGLYLSARLITYGILAGKRAFHRDYPKQQGE